MPSRFLVLEQQADGARFHRFATTDGAHAFGRLGLDADLIDRDAERAGDALAHRRDVRRELGGLGDHGRVDVADVPAGDLDPSCRLRQQGQRVGTPVLGVGVRKVMADVAERGGPEQGVGDRMAERIGVGVAGQTVRVSAENGEMKFTPIEGEKKAVSSQQ